MLDAKKKQGKVVIGKDVCLVGKMTNETRESLKQCKESEVLVLENTTEDNSDAICVSQTTEKARKAVCVDECGGKRKCAQLCNQRGDAMTADHKQVASTINLEEIFPGTHFVDNSLKKHTYSMNDTMLYPDWECQDAAEIQADGSLRLNEKREAGQVLRYGEFCIEPLAECADGECEALQKGRYRVKTSWLKEVMEEGEVEKNYVYYSVVLCISIVCLIVTIVIYAAFPALLKSMYNKIMMNFAVSLLVGFLSLVVMQTLSKEAQTPATCTGLSLLQQFSILAAFSLMTLMSYNIFVQLYQMRAGDTSGFKLRLALCYIVPGVITILTLIVELAAPQCASVRPKFGTR